MTVVAGGGAQELHGLLGAPRAPAAGAALEPQVDEDVAHHHEAGGATRDESVGRHAEQLAEDVAEVAETLQAAVVAHVGAGGVVVVVGSDIRPSARSSCSGAGLPRVRSRDSPRRVRSSYDERAASRNAVSSSGDICSAGWWGRWSAGSPSHRRIRGGRPPDGAAPGRRCRVGSTWGGGARRLHLWCPRTGVARARATRDDGTGAHSVEGH